MDQPVGSMTPPGAAVKPSRTTITGRFGSLEPLDPSHVPSLAKHIAGPTHDALWTYMLTSCPPDMGTFEKRCSQWSASSDPLFFAVVAGEGEDREALGMISYLSIVPEHRRVEIGSVILGEKLRRTRIATEAFYGILRRAFDELGYLRVEWKCNDLNKASKNAATRLGFTYEGIFRQHMVVKGKRRDTAWFSMIKEEWPAVKKRFEEWLSNDNFDEEGRQKRRLQDCCES